MWNVLGLEMLGMESRKQRIDAQIDEVEGKGTESMQCLAVAWHEDSMVKQWRVKNIKTMRALL